MFTRALLLLSLAAAAYGQLTPNSVTVMATKNSSVQPDQALFRLTVKTNVDGTRDEVLGAAQSLGITLANFTGVTTVQSYTIPAQAPQSSLAWTFDYPVDLANMKATVATLSALQQTIAQRKNGMSLDYSISGTQISPRLARAEVCPLGDLMTDARAQALKLAGAAGMGLGAVLAISSPVVNPAGSTGLVYTPSIYGVTPVCSMTVKFALGAF